MAARKTAIEYYSDLASRWPRGGGRAPTNNELEQAFALLYELNPNKRPRGPRGGSAEALAVAGYLGGVWNPLELGRAIAQATGGGVNEWLNIIEQPPSEGMAGLGLFTLDDNGQRGAQRKLSIALTNKGRQVVEKYCVKEGIPYFLAEEDERQDRQAAPVPADSRQDQNSSPTEPESDLPEREFAEEAAASPMDADAALYSRAKRLAAEGLDALMAKYESERNARPPRPNTTLQLIKTYDRSSLVVAIARMRADNRCEVPNCDHPTFLDDDGVPYTEVHHIERLSEGGPDVLENVACLCPAHHREVHLGLRAAELTAELRTVRDVR